MRMESLQLGFAFASLAHCQVLSCPNWYCRHAQKKLASHTPFLVSSISAGGLALFIQKTIDDKNIVGLHHTWTCRRVE
jgi:hypothetical protein